MLVVLVRIIQPPCISNLVPFSPCVLAQLAFARALESVNNITTKTIRLVARIKVYCQNVVWSRTVQLCRYSFDTLTNFSASLPRNVDVVAQRRTTYLGVLHRRGRCCSTRTIISTIPGVPWSFNGSGRVVSCEHGCWTRTRRHNSSSRYLSSYADEVRLCRPTPEARDLSLTSGWRPGYSRCRLLAADPLALPFLVLSPSLLRLTLTVLNWLYVCSGHYQGTNSV